MYAEPSSHIFNFVQSATYEEGTQHLGIARLGYCRCDIDDAIVL